MNKGLIALLLAIGMLLCGCAIGSPGEEGGKISVYRLDMSPGGSILAREKIRLEADGTALEALVEALNGQSNIPELRSAFPDDVIIESISLEKGVATVTMSPAYLALRGTEKLLAESALVLSLSTLDVVCSVDIICMNSSIASSLTAESYLEADGLCGAYERNLKLYLPDSSFEYLEPRSIQTSQNTEIPLAEAMLWEIFRAIGGGVEDCQIISADVSDGVCRLELSQEFYGKEPADTQKGRLVIYSVVNSLCRVPGIEAVTVTVEGIDVESYGDFNTVWPMKADMNLVKYQEK